VIAQLSGFFISKPESRRKEHRHKGTIPHRPAPGAVSFGYFSLGEQRKVSRKKQTFLIGYEKNRCAAILCIRTTERLLHWK
jgi:hypothetical protein